MIAIIWEAFLHDLQQSTMTGSSFVCYCMCCCCCNAFDTLIFCQSTCLPDFNPRRLLPDLDIGRPQLGAYKSVSDTCCNLLLMRWMTDIQYGRPSVHLLYMRPPYISFDDKMKMFLNTKNPIETRISLQSLHEMLYEKLFK